MLLVAAVSLVMNAAEPSPSVAEAPTEPASPEAPGTPAAPEPNWSIGAGFVTGIAGYSIGLLGLGSTAIPVTATQNPGASALLERRLGGRSYLMLDLMGSYMNAHVASPADASVRQRSLGADVGIRYVVTPPDSIVDVSVLGVANVDVSDYVTNGGTFRNQAQWSVGVSGGLAAERKLAPGLYVRLSTPILSASYFRTTYQFDGADPTASSGVNVGLHLAPRLELRLAF
jgi:hypothetical protein